MKKFLSMAATAVLSMSSSLALAGPITTLFNTGVDAAGAVVAHNTVGDAHYTLLSVTLGSTSLAVPQLKAATGAGEGFPIPPWVGDNTTSRWIGPNAADLNGVLNAVYQYRTTFDLTGADPLTALISGRWASDDSNGYMVLNGNAVGTNSTGFASWTNFSINQHFVAGINTLDFFVTNSGGGPTGLRVEMTGTVPEPTALALVAIALLGAGCASRRRSA